MADFSYTMTAFTEAIINPEDIIHESYEHDDEIYEYWWVNRWSATSGVSDPLSITITSVPSANGTAPAIPEPAT